MTAQKYCVNKEENRKPPNYFQLFRFATPSELFLIGLGVFFALINSTVMPIILMLYSEFTTLLIERTYRVGTTSETVLLHLLNGGKILKNASIEENRIETINDSFAFMILMNITAIIQLLSCAIAVDLFNYSALKQVTRIRMRFFSSIVRQEIGWYDTMSGNSFADQMTQDMEKIREGISEKLAMFISLIVSFFICVIISFLYGWKLTLVVLGCVPFLLITNFVVAKFQTSLTTKELEAYSRAGIVAQEALAAVRTVIAFGGEKKEAMLYRAKLAPAQKFGQRRGMFTGIGEGGLRFFLYVCNALSFWYGTKLIIEDRDKEVKEYTPAVMMMVFLGVLVGAENLAKTAPFLEAFATARGAAVNIFSVIDRRSQIDPMANEGMIAGYGIKGDIRLQNITFHYPARKDVAVLQDFNLNINAGEVVALVGASGCGKSTCLQLLQRFYDPIEGKITIDGIDIANMNIGWLRSNIATVGQEPVLFATTIRRNILMGKPESTQDDIYEAAKIAGAHEFISKLPEGYDTMVGEQGAQLSGGQKQRIAIARALIQNPKILLLDEATSALDNQTEQIVQDALLGPGRRRTTIIVSHKITVIKRADRIVFLEKGVVCENGSHDELMKLKKKYYNMVRSGNLQRAENFEPEDTEIENHQNDEHNGRDLKTQTNVLKTKLADDETNVPDRQLYIQTFKKLIKISKEDWPFLILAVFTSAIFGVTIPIFAVLFGEILGGLSLPDLDEVRSVTNTICIALIAVGSMAGFAVFLQNYFFNLSGVYLSTRIRSLVFASMMRQEMGWFDDESNSVGALCARLAGDSANVQSAIGFPIGGLVQACATLVCTMTVAAIYSWKMGLVCFAVMPFVVGACIFEARYMALKMVIEKKGIEDSTQIASEAITNIRTVASLRQEPHVIVRYADEITKVEKTIRQKLKFRGMIFACGQAVPFFGYAFGLYYGGMLVAKESVPFQDIIKVSEAVIFGAMMLGQALALAPALTGAFVAADRLFKIIERKPRVQSVLAPVRGCGPQTNITFSQTEFQYPTRPDVSVLQGLDLTIHNGKTIALVGPSGCGKSTCIQLLQRLYDPTRGKIFLNNSEIVRDVVLKDLRARIGIVSQEPVLFDRTIAENIAYGDNSRIVQLAEIIEAAKNSNIHEFIISLPSGYDTNLGTKGAQLSGGQKQRIAIARALIRNPKLLLLDEATSALDPHSEKVVQMALDSARTGRTCIIIAHRLTTVQNADLICVIQNGKVVESGTHDELIAIGQIYARLYCRTLPTNV